MDKTIENSAISFSISPVLLRLVSLTLGLLLLVSCSGGSSPKVSSSVSIIADTRPAKFEPNDQQVLFFIGQDNEGVGGNQDIYPPYTEWNKGYLDSDLPKPIGVTHYIGLVENVGFRPSGDKRVAGLWGATDVGAGPSCLKCYLESPLIDVSNLAIHLSIWYAGNDHVKAIAQGKRDDLIQEIAEFLAEYSHIPFFIRPGYEFDYQYQNIGVSAKDYRLAFQRIVDQLRMSKLENFATVFSSSHFTTGYGNWVDYYPGNDYVDWIGYSTFDAHQIPAVSDGAIQFAHAVNKPIMIAEAAWHDQRIATLDADGNLIEDNGQQSWDNYFASLFKQVDEFPYDIKAIAYINTNWSEQSMWSTNAYWDNTDSRIQISPILSDYWANELELPRYITNDQNLFSIIRFAPDE